MPRRDCTPNGSAAGVKTLSLFTFLLLSGISSLQIPMPAHSQEAARVLVAKTYEADIVNDAEFLGRVEAIDKVDLVARVSGFMKEIMVKGGASVTNGEVLFKIEDEQYAATQQAREADLERAKAELKLASLELDRKEQLLERATASVAERDTAEANERVARAAVKSAEAALQQASLDLSYTTVTAPFEGRIGKIAVSEGELVGPSSRTLASLVREAPIYVTFSLNEKQLAQIMQRLGKEPGTLAKARDIPEVYVSLPDGSLLDEMGHVAFIENRIDPQTASITLRAEFENAQRLLVDGAYVNLRIASPDPVKRLLVPQAAVQRDQRGQFVLVVTSQNQVEQRYIQTDVGHEGNFIVTDGLKPDEQVIVEGLQRVRPGAAVDPVLATSEE